MMSRRRMSYLVRMFHCLNYNERLPAGSLRPIAGGAEQGKTASKLRWPFYVFDLAQGCRLRAAGSRLVVFLL